MRKLVLSLVGGLLLTLCVGSVEAQQSFEEGTAVYSKLNSNIRIAKDSVWDEINTLPINEQWVALGFTFQAFGHSFDTIWLDQAGFWDVSEEVFVGLWADLCDKGRGTKIPKSPIIVSHEGTAGNKIVKIEWQNFGFVGDYVENSVCTDSGNVQIWIYENPMKIEMRFGKSHIAFASKNFPAGIIVTCSSDNGAGTTSGVDLSGDPANPTTKPYNPSSQAKLTGFPAENTLYKFNFGQSSTPNIHKPLDVTVKRTTVYTSGISDFTVMDAQGRLVAHSKGVSEISLSHLPPAVYIVNCNSGNERTTLKVLVSN